MARILWLLSSFLVCLHNGEGYPYGKVSDKNLDDESMTDSYVQTSRKELLQEYVPKDDENVGTYGEEKELMKQDYSRIGDEDNVFNGDYNAEIMENDKTEVNKEVDEILNNMDHLNDLSKGKSLNENDQVEDAEFEDLYKLAAEAAKKKQKTKEEIKEATKEKMIKKNKEIYKAMMKIGMKVDKIANKKGVKVPKVIKSVRQKDKVAKKNPKGVKG